MRRTRRTLLVAGLLGAVGAACGEAAPATNAPSGAPTTSATKAPATAPTVGAAPTAAPTVAPIKATTAGPIWILDHPLQLPVRKALEARVAEFEKAFPGAKVEYEGVVEPNDNQEKFAILLAAGTMPDASATHTGFMQQWPHFSDLKPYLAKDTKLKADDYFATIFKAFDVQVGTGTRQIGIPREVHATVLYYSRSAVTGAGLKEPSKDWTHQEFVDWALKLSEWKENPQEAKWAIHNATALGGAAMGLPIFWEFGAEFFSPDGKTCIIDQQPARDAFQYLSELVSKHHITPSPAELAASGLTGSQQAMFGTGRFRGYASNQNTAPVGTNAVSFDWDLQLLPQVPGKKRATRMAGNAYGIITNGKNKNPDLAWELVKSFVGDDGSTAQMQAGNFMANKKATEKWPETRAPAKNGKVVFEAMDGYARLEHRPKGWDKAMVVINREWTKVLNGEQSIGGMISIAKPEAEAILKTEQGG
ncbi:MAG: extracellular solute-binding protein [Chloroflexota bacterium]|nr:extracellular solute-binding protein [Chloroflexota bacterium]